MTEIVSPSNLPRMKAFLRLPFLALLLTGITWFPACSEDQAPAESSTGGTATAGQGGHSGSAAGKGGAGSAGNATAGQGGAASGQGGVAGASGAGQGGTSAGNSSAGSGGSSAGSGGSSNAGAGGSGSSGTSGQGGAAQGGTSQGGAGGGGAGGSAGGAANDTLSAQYPGDEGLGSDPSVIFHDDFEGGWGKWNSPKKDTTYLHLEENAGLAHTGSHYLRSTVTKDHLDVEQYISSATHFTFPTRVDQVFWRFHVRVKGIAPNPHHWFRMTAGTEAFNGSGLANTVPPGDQGFWFDLDANNDDLFNFYVYWYKMRSGRCNDGTAVPGCAGDQGTTYYYGNTFRPPGQTPFARDAWFCVEIMGKANTVGQNDGQLSYWVNDQPVGDFRQGYPDGTWLRDTFHPGGCSFSACTEPKPFEGFDFRTSNDVRFKHISLDAYYQRDTFQSKKEALEAKGLTVSDEQTIYYDDVVVATKRIGCKKPK